MFGNNGSCSLILVILVRENFGEVEVAWCGTIENCKGGGCTWGGVAGCWCQVAKIVILSMFTVCHHLLTLKIN